MLGHAVLEVDEAKTATCSREHIRLAFGLRQPGKPGALSTGIPTHQLPVCPFVLPAIQERRHAGVARPRPRKNTTRLPTQSAIRCHIVAPSSLTISPFVKLPQPQVRHFLQLLVFYYHHLPCPMPFGSCLLGKPPFSLPGTGVLLSEPLEEAVACHSGHGFDSACPLLQKQ